MKISNDDFYKMNVGASDIKSDSAERLRKKRAELKMSRAERAKRAKENEMAQSQQSEAVPVVTKPVTEPKPVEKPVEEPVAANTEVSDAVKDVARSIKSKTKASVEPEPAIVETPSEASAVESSASLATSQEDSQSDIYSRYVDVPADVVRGTSVDDIKPKVDENTGEIRLSPEDYDLLMKASAASNAPAPVAPVDEPDKAVKPARRTGKVKSLWAKKSVKIAVASVCALALITGIGFGVHQYSINRDKVALAEKMDKEKKVAETKAKEIEIKTVDDVKEKLSESAKVTTQPFEVKTSALGGGYTLGVITYYPEDSTKTYMDYSITAPDKPDEVVNDDKAKEIEEKLKSELPTINKTITVMDGSKVTMATYKQDDAYHTILMYDGNPFGFVATDKDGLMVNNVTTYYIQKVQQNN